MTRPSFMDTAKKVFQEYHPDALAAFVGGSIVRGEDTETSDIDLVVLYDDDFQDVRRQSIVCDGWPVEIFVHNPKAQDYFFNKDREGGVPTMLNIISEGIEIPSSTEISRARKDKANEMLKTGPAAFSKDDFDRGRYMITDRIDDIDGAARKGETCLGSLSLMYNDLGHFYLRAHGEWSGHGKHLIKALAKKDSNLAKRYDAAFTQAFRGEGCAAVLGIANEMLTPFGGRFWEGYEVRASDDWKGL